MSGTPNSNLKNPKTNLLESSGRPFTLKFSDQSSSNHVSVQSGAVESLHNMDKSLNVPHMQGSLASRNAEVTSLSSSGFQQPRFVSNHPAMARTQMASRNSQLHSDIASRGGLGVSNVAGLATRLNLTTNRKLESFDVLTPDSLMNATRLQGNNDYFYSMDMHQNEQNFHGNALSMMQNQHIPISKAARYSLLTINQPHPQLQKPQNQQLHDSGGVSFPSTSTQDHLYMRGGSDLFPSTFHRQTSGSSIGIRRLDSSNSVSGINPYAQLNQQYQQDHNQSPVRLQQNMVNAATQSCRDQSLKPSDTSTGHFTPSDRYGVLGLDKIRLNNTNIASLASGIDLRTLGLDLLSKDLLYKIFASPWADGPVEEEPDQYAFRDYVLPEYVVPEYYNATPPLPLHRGYFKQFRLHSLFYIFYSMPNDEAQLHAADELHSRGWFYHKKEQQWLTRTSKMKPQVKTASYEIGTYYYFDLNRWNVNHKENFFLNYDDLDFRPVIN